jgi:hypothetical protein
MRAESSPAQGISSRMAVRFRPRCVVVELAKRSRRRARMARSRRRPGRSAAVVEGHLVAVGVREREGAAERPVDGR